MRLTFQRSVVDWFWGRNGIVQKCTWGTLLNPLQQLNRKRLRKKERTRERYTLQTHAPSDWPPPVGHPLVPSRFKYELINGESTDEYSSPTDPVTFQKLTSDHMRYWVGGILDLNHNNMKTNMVDLIQNFVFYFLFIIPAFVHLSLGLALSYILWL